MEVVNCLSFTSERAPPKKSASAIPSIAFYGSANSNSGFRPDIAFLFPGYAELGAVRRGNLALLAEDNAQSAIDLAKPPRIEGEGDFDRAIRRSVDFKPKPPRSEFHQMQLEVPGIRFWFVRLNITNAAILVFELALNQQVRPDGRREIKVRIRVLRVKENLEIEPVKVTG
jgi:hypothetical protein